MALLTSICRLARNRYVQLMRCLVETPARSLRPILAKLTRSTLAAAAADSLKVLS